MKSYKLYDSTGHLIKMFRTYSEADNFRIINNRRDWEVKI